MQNKTCDSSSKQTAVGTTPAKIPQVDRKPIICFTCHQQGHKSPQCPKKQQGRVYRDTIPSDSVKSLRNNEVMGEV